jgi:CheY-like chemotaxis protein
MNLNNSVSESGVLSTPKPKDEYGRVLFVDDEEMLRNVVVRMLERLPYRTTSFSDPAEALAAFRAGPNSFDVILTDCNMPKLTGLELAAEVLQIRPGMPVVLTTGVRQQVESDKAANLGISEMLIKPFGFRGLAEALAKAIGNPG